MSDKSIGITVKHLQLLKNYVLNNDFQSHEDEIHSSKILNLNSLLN